MRTASSRFATAFAASSIWQRLLLLLLLRRHRSQVMELSEISTASSRSAAASAALSASARCRPFSCTGSGACGRRHAAVSHAMCPSSY